MFLRVGLIIFMFFVVIVGLAITQKGAKSNVSQTAIVSVGPSKGQQRGLNIELEKALKQAQYIEHGKRLLEEGKFDDAITQFNTAFNSAKTKGDKGVAISYMADVYEKKRDYKKTLEYVTIDRDWYINSWAKASVEERVIYLNYVLQGDYDLAIQHAQKALDVFKETFSNIRTSTGGYAERLNDLKAAKDYILSLKKYK